MTRQYRITTQNVNPVDEGDCYLAPTDPVQALKASAVMGGLGAQQRLAEYNWLTQQEQAEKLTKQQVDAQAQGIRPGSPAWYAFIAR